MNLDEHSPEECQEPRDADALAGTVGTAGIFTMPHKHHEMPIFQTLRLREIIASGGKSWSRQ